MEELLVALGIGLAAGFSPGPLLTLVVSATLERGFGAGLRVASSPLVTDLPIIAASIGLLRGVPDAFLAGVTLAGGVFVIYVGLDTLRRCRRPQDPGAGSGDPAYGSARDLWRGALVNVLSPHPWFFWLGVGVPMVLRLWGASPLLSVAWVAFFYGGLVGAKAFLAWIVAKGRKRLDQRWYRAVLAACGVVLAILGALLVWRGLHSIFPETA